MMILCFWFKKLVLREVIKMNLKLLKQKREEKGMTLQEMSDALFYKSKSSYSNLEKGVVKIPIETAKKIQIVLSLSDLEFKDIFLAD